VTILDAIYHPNLFRSLFKSLDTWRAWLAVLRAVFGLPMEEARPCALHLADRPEMPVEESWLICGRRAGKSFVVSVTGVYLNDR